MKTDIIRGGKSDYLSIEDIAKKHEVSVEYIKFQLKKGISVEMEHTDNATLAAEIALDHLYERPDYYSKLIKMEKEPVEIDALRNEIYEILLILEKVVKSIAW